MGVFAYFWRRGMIGEECSVSGMISSIANTMAKYGNRILPKEDVERIFFKLCESIASMKNAKEASQFLRDILSYQEAEMVAMRLQIAELLEEGKTYDEIRGTLKVGSTTIAKVHEWLKVSGDGFRLALERTKGKEKMPFESVGQRGFVADGLWRNVKRRYPMYYWPELLLEEIMLSANSRQKEKMRNVLKELEKSQMKTKIASQLKRFLSPK
jgi:TrpR-related protein YerC/YecD